MSAPTWTAKVLNGPPMIAPARQFTYPKPVPGEEDALQRGAVFVEIKPAHGGVFLATCAIGFQTGSVANGIYASPNPDEICIAAGGYVYLVDTIDPDRSTHVELRPVTQVMKVPEVPALVFVGFHHMVVYSAESALWQTPRLSWEGISEVRVDGDVLHGLGWNMPEDKEVPFTVNLKTRETSGGGFAAGSTH